MTEEQQSEALSVETLAEESGATGHSSAEETRVAHDLKTLFNMFDRLVTMLRVYPRGHPILDEIAGQIETRFKTAFEDHGDIFEVLVDATALSTAEETEFFSRELSDKQQYIWYEAYADGLLALTFRQGLMAAEILDFLGVIDRSAQGVIDSDDDTITLLWELELPHLDYHAVEGFADGAAVETFEGMNEPDAVNLVASGIEDPKGEEARRLIQMFENLNLQHVDIFTRMQLRAGEQLSAPEIRDEDLAYAFVVDQSVIDKLSHEWHEGVDLEYRLIEALLSIVRGAPASEAAERASEMIVSITHQLLDRAMYAQATRILELLHDRRALFTDSDFDPLGDLIEELSDPLRLEALIYTLQKKPGERGALINLLLLLGPDRVQTQVLRLLADDSKNIVAASQLVDVVVQATTPENEHQILNPEFVKNPIYLRRLLRELGNRDAESFSPTPRLIRAALGVEDIETIAAALKIEHPVWSDERIAEKYLMPLAMRQEEEIRKYAMERLSEFHPRTFENVIRDSILARDSQGRSFGEVRFLMRMYLEANEAEAVSHLREMLEVKGWLSESKRDFAKMAAAVLIEHGDEQALQAVREAAESVWVNHDLKRSYTTTLKRFARKDTDASEVSDDG